MGYCYCRSPILSPNDLRFTALNAMKRRDSFSSNYSDTLEVICIRLAEVRLQSMEIFDLDPANGVKCEFTVPYSDSEFPIVFEMVRDLAGRVNSVRAETIYETQVETTRGIAHLKYGAEIIHNSIVQESKLMKDVRSFIAAVGYGNVYEGVDKEGRKEAIRKEFFQILSVTGLDKEISLQEENGEFKVVSRGPYTFEREPITPSCLSLTNIDSFDKAMAFLTKVLSALPLRKTEIHFYCRMNIEDYEWFRAEYADLVRPWMIDGYGQLRDWVKPFAPIEELPPDAPMEVPIFQEWDSSLKYFTMGRILRTPEGLRLLVYTNKGDAKSLAKRMNKATGVDYEIVDQYKFT